MATPLRTVGLCAESPYSWIKLSHVCKHWRAIALDSAKLWGRVHLTAHREWTSAVLMRSAETPLEVFAEFPMIYENTQDRAVWMASFRLVLEEIPRIRSLVISSQQKLDAEVLDMFNRPAPLLKELRLYHLVFDAPEVTCDGPPKILGLISQDRSLARLESLSLYKCHIPWFELDMQTLKDLTIVGLPWGGMSRSLDMQTLVQILCSTPALECLVIRNAFRPMSSIYAAPLFGPPALLSRLRDIKLYGCSADVIKLLDHLQLPALTHLYMAVDAPLVDPADNLAASVMRKMVTSGEISTLYIKGEGYHTFSLEGHVTPSSPRDDVVSSTANVFHIRVSSTHCRRIFSGFIRHSSLNCMHTLDITTLYRKRIWVSIIENCRNVSELVVRGKRATKILYRTLHPMAGVSSDDEKVPVAPLQLPFPHLRSLSLCNLREQGFSSDDASHNFIQFWRDRLEDRRGVNNDLAVVVQKMVAHECVPNTLRSLCIALVPRTEAGSM